MDPGSSSKKPGRDAGFIRDVIEFISGDLFFEKLVVWFVLIERVDNVVAISPRVKVSGVMRVVTETRFEILPAMENGAEQNKIIRRRTPPAANFTEMVLFIIGQNEYS